MHGAAEPGVGKGVELYFSRLSRFHLCQAGFGHIGLDQERRHVGNGHDRGPGIARRAERRDDVSHIGVLGQDHGIKGRSDARVFHGHVGGIEGGLGCVDR